MSLEGPIVGGLTSSADAVCYSVGSEYLTGVRWMMATVEEQTQLIQDFHLRHSC